MFCDRCQHPHAEVSGCDANPEVLLRSGPDRPARVLRRVRFGQERWTGNNTRFCPACHARRGKLHHLSCEWERCPGCGMQTTDCPCQMAPYELLMQATRAGRSVRAYGMGFTRAAAQRMAERRLTSALAAKPRARERG